MRIKDAAMEMLENQVIPFWLSIKDQEYGGFYGYADFDGHIDREAVKGCILHSRILWFFSEAAMLLKRDDLREAADHAYRFLTEYCLDRENGGILWSVTYDGKPSDTQKHTYNQAFAIYAFSAYYRLSKNPEALQHAMDIFHLVEEKCTDSEGFLEGFTIDWQPSDNDKLSENGVQAAKTMNTLLHVVEGYSGLLEASGDPEVLSAVRRCHEIFTEKVYSPELGRQLVFFDEHYHSIINLYSYGHDIESSWLLDWSVGLLQDPVLQKTVNDIDSVMAENIKKHAYYNRSISNECDRGEVDTGRVWWVQAECVLGFLNEWRKHPEKEEFRTAAGDVFCFIRDYMVDQRFGEWFSEVKDDGTPLPLPILEPWKCPYHNGRMLMQLIRIDPDITV